MMIISENSTQLSVEIEAVPVCTTEWAYGE
jgi:hypothetical protein